MKKTLCLLAVFCLCLSVLTARAAGPTSVASTRTDSSGKNIAKTLSEITGVAISPLLGVSVVGAWDYFHAETPEAKARLNWYADPMFWVPALLLVSLCALKDSGGIVVPAALKKPFDVLETMEHKFSGLIATGAFVPLVASVFHSSYTTPGASLSSMGFASIDLSWLYNSLMVPVMMVAFFIVFLASNAVNIIILLSPFPPFDAALKAFRTSIIASIAVSSWMNPWVGAAWAIIVIGFCYLISGWSFRLSHFGTVFLWDFFTRRSARFVPEKGANKMFLGRKLNKVPARTYGKLSRDDKGSLVFDYHPWLIFPARKLVLPEAKYAVGTGMFFSEILQLDGENSRIVLLLPPRYRSHENELVAIYGLVDVRDTGLRAAWQWLKATLGFKPQTAAGN